MTKEYLDKIYKSKGGTKQLYLMMENLETLKTIAVHFGVSRQRIAQWSKEVFGKSYNPISKRRERRELGIK